MRRHIYRVLGVNPEDGLPPSHHEGLPLSAKEPVRFVWEKTIKQSKHNAQMKERVLADLRANRRLTDMSRSLILHPRPSRLLSTKRSQHFAKNTRHS
jgi:hypothetical protein